MRGIRRLLTLLVASSAMLLCSCTWIYAQMVSEKVADDLLALERYRGRLVERGVLGGGTSEEGPHLVKEVTYLRPFRTRVEVLAPESHAGDLVLYDGRTLVLWWPRHLVGVRIAGAPPPSEASVRAALEADTLWALERYAFAYQGELERAGRRATHWKAFPQSDMQFLYPYESVLDKEHSLPLGVTVFDAPGHVWYEASFESIDFAAPVAEEAFAFSFPKRAVVFEWDLTDPAVPAGTLREEVNFELLAPAALPEGLGLQVEKWIRGRHQLPMAALLMRGGGRWLSLTEARSANVEPDVGVEIHVGGREVHLSFLGGIASATWTQQGTALCLIGNVPYPELLAVVRSVGPVGER